MSSRRIRGGLKLKVSTHKVKEEAPTGTEAVAGQDAAVVEEGAPGAEFLTNQLIRRPQSQIWNSCNPSCRTGGGDLTSH
jgi:hypothetical protein